jgi:hypothetical protein
MLRAHDQATPPTELRLPVRYLGDNLDRLLGLLAAARAEQDRRARAERAVTYRLAAERTCA